MHRRKKQICFSPQISRKVSFYPLYFSLVIFDSSSVVSHFFLNDCMHLLMDVIVWLECFVYNHNYVLLWINIFVDRNRLGKTRGLRIRRLSGFLNNICLPLMRRYTFKLFHSDLKRMIINIPNHNISIYSICCYHSKYLRLRSTGID